MVNRWVCRGARPEKERRTTLGGLGREGGLNPDGEKDGNAAEATEKGSEDDEGEMEGKADFREAMLHTSPLLLLEAIAFAQNPI